MKFLVRQADSKRKNSIASRYRQRRMNFLFSCFEQISTRPIRILDIGGTVQFWQEHTFKDTLELELTIINLEKMKSPTPNINCIIGDARELSQFTQKEIDVVFSNSLIEHVGNWNDQKKMASEVLSLNAYYFVQTPAFVFPIEQHFLMPFFHWLPISLRVWLHQHF